MGADAMNYRTRATLALETKTLDNKKFTTCWRQVGEREIQYKGKNNCSKMITMITEDCFT